MKKIIALFVAVLSFGCFAEVVVDITGAGAVKYPVSINVSGTSSAAFAKYLRKNLELSGCFTIASDASIKVSGTVGGTVTASGRGASAAVSDAVTDDKSARMAARKLSDAMCAAFAQQKGFACDRIAFISKSAKGEELCVCYPDGQDFCQISKDGKTAVGPHWKNNDTLFYTGYLTGGPQIWERNVNTGKAKLLRSFKGLATGAVPSPDGTKVAVVLSFQGNPELYIIDMAKGSWQRLTTTPHASEGCPSWSPDGKKLVYVSDEAKHPQLYIVDVATKEKRRITSKGSQNVEPDWGKDGRIVYITKRGGLSQIAVLEPAEGDSSAKLIGKPGSWKEPSWSRDMRHVVASRDKALFVVDTMENGDDPKQLFMNNGNWIMPCWAR